AFTPKSVSITSGSQLGLIALLLAYATRGSCGERCFAHAFLWSSFLPQSQVKTLVVALRNPTPTAPNAESCLFIHFAFLPFTQCISFCFRWFPLLQTDTSYSTLSLFECLSQWWLITTGLLCFALASSALICLVCDPICRATQCLQLC